MKLLFALALFTGATVQVPAVPETYVVEPNRTAARSEYNHFGFAKQLYRFDRISGQTTFDRAARTAAVDIKIDPKSVNTGFPSFAGHLRGEEFLNQAMALVITFPSRGVKFDSDKPLHVEGELTSKGIAPVTLTLSSFQAKPSPMSQKRSIGAAALAQAKRSDFNLGKFAPAVGDDVTLRISVEAHEG